MAERPPLSTLLSQLLIAFTIEFDNEAECQIVASGARRFLTSLVMWSNFMRFFGEAGVPVRDVPEHAGVPRTPVRTGWIQGGLGGLQRWGYITVAPDHADRRAKPPRPDWVIHATPFGRAAQQIWRPLPEVIEARWRTRFGEREISRLRASLLAVADRFDVELPRYLPIAANSDGMRTFVPHLELDVPTTRAARDLTGPDLSVLLARVLLVFAVEFEREANVSLAIGANALRVLDETGGRVRDLPGRAGVSTEAISASLGFLERRGHVVVESAERAKWARLTEKGRRVQDAHAGRLDAVEARWRARFGAPEIDELRGALQDLFDQRDGDRSRLGAGLTPHPGGWRARRPYATQTDAFVRDPGRALPHFPMVLHRGGWPDGS